MLRTLKKNRSDKYTKGIAITNNSNDLRFPFFDLDFDFQSSFGVVEYNYRDIGLDYLIHRTGNGYHFISPTLLNKEEWKEFHEPIKRINPECPQTTLRWLPNKYPDENDVWFIAKPVYSNQCFYRNSYEMCCLLNTTFGSDFRGAIETDLKFVRYPLPK